MNTRLFYITFLSFIFCSFITLASENQEEQDIDPFVVVLDAGHGGHDPGNLGNGYLEKNIALNIVLNVGKILEQNPNIKVVYTRKDDTFIDLFVRGEIANKANADLFVSVHCDSHSSDAHGAGTFVLGLHANKQNFEIAKKENSVIYLEDNYESRYADYDINSPESVIGLTIMQEEFLDQSISLAKMIQDNFTGNLKRKDRKVKQAGFIVLHQTFMPSVLVETGFLTNKSEGQYLNSLKGQKEMGSAIAKAILKYKEGIQGSTFNTPISTKEEEMLPVVEPIKKEEKQDTPPAVEVVKEEKKTVEKPEVVIKEDEKPAVVVKEKSKPSKPIVKVEEKEVKKESVELPIDEKGKSRIEFRVQIMATVKVIPLDGDNFNGLNKLSKEQYKNFYRYMYGNVDTYQAAKLLKSNADLKGYKTSYIVAYKDGKRIPVKEALKYVSQ